MVGRKMARSGSRTLIFIVAVVTMPCTDAIAQDRDGQGEPLQTPREIAPVDFTGYWDAIVVEDWRYRMLPPLRYQDDPQRLGDRI